MRGAYFLDRWFKVLDESLGEQNYIVDAAQEARARVDGLFRQETVSFAVSQTAARSAEPAEPAEQEGEKKEKRKKKKKKNAWDKDAALRRFFFSRR